MVLGLFPLGQSPQPHHHSPPRNTLCACACLDPEWLNPSLPLLSHWRTSASLFSPEDAVRNAVYRPGGIPPSRRRAGAALNRQRNFRSLSHLLKAKLHFVKPTLQLWKGFIKSLQKPWVLHQSCVFCDLTENKYLTCWEVTWRPFDPGRGSLPNQSAVMSLPFNPSPMHCIIISILWLQVFGICQYLSLS